MKYSKQFIFAFGVLGSLIISSFLGHVIGVNRNSFNSSNNTLDRLYLQIDFETDRPYVRPAMFRTDKENIYYYNEKTNALKVYDKEGGHVKTNISLDKVWFEFHNVHVISPDSILLYTRYRRNNLYLVNGQGQRIETYKTWPQDSLIKDVPRMVGERNGSIAHVDSLIYVSHRIYDVGFHDEHPAISVINLDTKKTVLSDDFPKYSEIVETKRLPPMPVFLTPALAAGAQSSLAINYGFSNQLYLFDALNDTLLSKKTEVTGFEGVSLLPKRIEQMSEKYSDRQMLDSTNISGQYTAVYYNSSKEVYYRVVKMPYDEAILKKYREDPSFRLKPFSYVVLKLDQDLNILEKREYPDSYFKWNLGSFVTDKGLWVMESDWRNTNEMIFVNVME